MSFEKKILEYTNLTDEIFRMRQKISGKTFSNQAVKLDFAHYEECIFENCHILIEYGVFTLSKNTFRKCRFEVKRGSPAHMVFNLFNRLRRPSGSLDLDKWK